MKNTGQEILYMLLKSIANTFTLPTDSTIFTTLCYSFALFVVSLVSSLFGLFHFVSWHGALLCVILLAAFLIKERAENDSLVKAYKAAEAVAKRAAKKAKTTGVKVQQKLEQQRSVKK